MNFKRLKDALLSVGVPVSHYTAVKKAEKYIVWAEDGQADAVWADDRMQTQAIQGTIDYFTKSEYDGNVQKIQAALNNGELSWRLNSIQYEDDTKFIHYEWVWEIDG